VSKAITRTELAERVAHGLGGSGEVEPFSRLHVMCCVRHPMEGPRMTEVVVAVYKTASAAETAVADLEVASVQTATVRQFVCDPVADEQLLEVRNQGTTSGDRVVAVTVDERHARTVMEILTMQDPAIITEAPLNAA
jgi:hypothetical protein